MYVTTSWNFTTRGILKKSISKLNKVSSENNYFNNIEYFVLYLILWLQIDYSLFRKESN